MNENVIKEAESWVKEHFATNVAKDFYFHDIHHTIQVVEACQEIASAYNISDEEMESLLLAAWFHDTGYDKGPEGHENRSAEYAVKFLTKFEWNPAKIKEISNCILATKLPQNPSSLLEQIIGDADMAHLGKGIYWDRVNRLRQELLVSKGISMNELEWVNFEIEFISNHDYHGIVSRGLYDVQKAKHLKQLKKQRKRLIAAEEESLPSFDEIMLQEKRLEKEQLKTKEALIKSEQELKQLRLGRGVETMYKTTYNTHLHLSQQSDSKANLMLSVNAIVISIAISNLIPKFNEDSRLIVPTVMLVATCLIAMVLATLSTRPKITAGQITRDDIINRRGNLLFFGNFFNMPLDDYQWGVQEMIKDSNYLYNSMTRDIYFLGVVLAKKYRYLNYCYNIFMYGLVLSVLAFGITHLLK